MLTKKEPKLLLMVVFQIACLNLMFTYADSLSGFQAVNLRQIKFLIGAVAFIFFLFREIRLIHSK